MAAPMSGIRVLDFCRAIQGPYGTMLLAELGAEVIKVETPGTPPAGVPDADGFSAYHESISRSKKSIAVNLRDKAGMEVVRRLVPTVDVVTENYRAGIMDQMGLGYTQLKKLRPDIILASASAWGPFGEWAERGGFDHVAQALSGIMSVQGTPEEPHALVGGIADVIGGTYLALAVNTALLTRERTGIGQHVDTSLLGSMTIIQTFQLTQFLRTGKQSGFVQRRAPTYSHYLCSDGKYIAIAANREPMWKRLCQAIERPELADEARFNLATDRSAHSDELVAIFEESFVRKTQSDWETILTTFDVPNAPVLDYAGVAQHPQFAANGYIQEFQHPTFGAIRVPGPPLLWSETPSAIQGAAPACGQDTDSVLLASGFSQPEIDALRSSKVVA